MITNYFKILVLVVISFFSFRNNCFAEKENIEPNIQITMRMIGHQVLLNSGDSLSRVLPIQKEGFRYKIPFQSNFEFAADELILTVNNAIKTLKDTVSYLVEVEDCITNEIIYSYKVGNSDASTIIPCRGRTQPKGCYTIFITFLDKSAIDFTTNYYNSNQSNSTNQENNKLFLSLSIITPLLLIGFFVFGRKKSENIKPNPTTNSNIISIGKYDFDKIKMTLSIENKTIELTGKETDLLMLLYENANQTLEREQILKLVWGDEGDYVGRTLDVFISKLRKKLTADTNLKIMNIRGVGYRFILDNA